MNTFVERVTALSIGTVLAGIVAVVVTPFSTVSLWNQWKLEKNQQQADRFRERVLASLQEGNSNDLFGQYRYSTGFEHIEFDLAPGGFFFRASNCTGTTDLAYGQVAEVDASRVRLDTGCHLVLEESSSTGARHRFRFSDDLYSIPWGKDRLLVPAELMQEFCSLSRARGWDSMTYADYPCKIAPGESAWDRLGSLEGTPIVPAEFRRYLPE